MVQSGYGKIASFLILLLVCTGCHPMEGLWQDLRNKMLVWFPSTSRVDLDRHSMHFLRRSASLDEVRQCLPIFSHEEDSVRVFYMHCSAEALVNEGKSEWVSRHFQASEPIARRYRFWERVYGLWSAYEYALHSAVYPEVVFEVIDVSERVGHRLHAAPDRAKRFARRQKRAYRDVLKALDRWTQNPSAYAMTAAMLRVKRLMAHIDDPRKYRRAAASIRLQRGQRDFLIKGRVESQKYWPHIQATFSKYDLPTELAYLAFVESSFNLKAYSKVGAAGVFQIMPATGKQYGMHIGDLLDERRDPIKSASVAAKLLKLNYRLTSDWSLAVTAYNHGVGSIRRAMRKTGASNIGEVIRRYQARSFGFASENFFSEFLAMVKTMQRSDVLFGKLDPIEPIAFSEVRISRATSLSKIRRRFDLSLADLEVWNPDLIKIMKRRGAKVPRGYRLKIPQKVETGVANSASSGDIRRDDI